MAAVKPAEGLERVSSHPSPLLAQSSAKPRPAHAQPSPFAQMLKRRNSKNSDHTAQASQSHPTETPRPPQENARPDSASHQSAPTQPPQQPDPQKKDPSPKGSAEHKTPLHGEVPQPPQPADPSPPTVTPQNVEQSLNDSTNIGRRKQTYQTLPARIKTSQPAQIPLQAPLLQTPIPLRHRIQRLRNPRLR